MMTCKECRYFEPNKGKQNGICCRHPATPIVTISQRDGGYGGHHYETTVEYHQPVMYDTEWCGEFKPPKPMSAQERIANKRWK